MGTRIEFVSDLGSFQEAHGSDDRVNVSARADSRGYYNARDRGQSYTLPFDHQSAAAGEYSAYWKNTSTTRALVISSIGVNAVQAARIKLWFVTGTAAAGAPLTPTNTNKTSPHDADANAREGAAASGISGLTTDGLIDFLFVLAGGHEEFRLGDRVRLGQNDAIAIEYDEGTTGDFAGTIFGYYE